MNFLIDTLVELPGKVVDFFMYIVETIASVFEALKIFYELLESFDQTIVQMAASCGTSEFTGMPILEAIGTFRYLVGDVAFYMMYMTILFGCLMTIYKLVILIYDAIDTWVEEVTGSNCKTQFTSLIGKIFG